MIANYGFEDGSGVYYISIDTDQCIGCRGKECIKACPSNLFALELDDWDDEVVVIKKDQTRLLKSCCAGCKAADNENERLPCQRACPKDAIRHTW